MEITAYTEANLKIGILNMIHIDCASFRDKLNISVKKINKCTNNIFKSN